jgi:hypothetical protein
MTPLDRINLYTANRQGLISREERDARLAAGDRLEDLCESVQDAVNEVIEECRQRGKRCAREHEELRISVYAYPYQSGDGICWGVDSDITHQNTKRGIVQ